jgi:hypothetical protein
MKLNFFESARRSFIPENANLLLYKDQKPNPDQDLIELLLRDQAGIKNIAKDYYGKVKFFVFHSNKKNSNQAVAVVYFYENKSKDKAIDHATVGIFYKNGANFNGELSTIVESGQLNKPEVRDAINRKIKSNDGIKTINAADNGIIEFIISKLSNPDVVPKSPKFTVFEDVKTF